MGKLKLVYILSVSVAITLLSTSIKASDGAHFSTPLWDTKPATNVRRGKITFLRVSTPKDKWGPVGRQVFAEVMIKLDTLRGKAYGFQLRKGSNTAANSAMFELLKDAYKYNWTVIIDVQEPTLLPNTPNSKPWNVGYILRVAVKRENGSSIILERKVKKAKKE